MKNQSSLTDTKIGSGAMPEIVDLNETTRDAAVESASGTAPSILDGGDTTTVAEPAGSAAEVSGQPAGLSEAERRALETILSPTEIEELDAKRRLHSERQSRTKTSNSDLIAAHADEMMVDATNKSLHSGRRVGTWLINHKLHEKVRGYNAFGDALGGHGLKLPHVTVNGRRYYDLGCVLFTEEQKNIRQAELKTMGIDVLRCIIAD